MPAGISRLLLFFLLALFSFCSPRYYPIPSQPSPAASPENLPNFDNAVRIMKQGSYHDLNKAMQIFSELHVLYPESEIIADTMYKACLLLVLRSKELGLLDSSFLSSAQAWLEQLPDSQSRRMAFKAASAISDRLKGIYGNLDNDEDLFSLLAWGRENAHPLYTELLSQPDDFFSRYLSLGLKDQFPYWIKNSEPEEPAADSTDVPIIAYKKAISGELDTKTLEKIYHDNPRFIEITLFLGEASLSRMAVGSAENYFLEFNSAFPQSLSGLMGMAQIYYVLEEFSPSLNCYHKILTIAPHYRETLLGNAICLSQLGRNIEAIQTCRQLRTLGKYFIGESYYWSAWNFFQLGLLNQARDHIRKAFDYMEGFPIISFLAGQIAGEMKLHFEAEKNFLETLKHDQAHWEAAFELGMLYSSFECYEKSGKYFKKAGESLELEEQLLIQQIANIQESEYSLYRKTRMINRKTRQLKSAQLKKAASFFNAAAGYSSFGRNKEVFPLLKKAMNHPYFKVPSEKLLKRINR